jgi:hypothetical protein
MSDDVERVAKIANLEADTEYKRMLTKWEPWKAMAVAFGAGATVAVALVAVLTFLWLHFGH